MEALTGQKYYFCYGLPYPHCESKDKDEYNVTNEGHMENTE